MPKRNAHWYFHVFPFLSLYEFDKVADLLTFELQSGITFTEPLHVFYRMANIPRILQLFWCMSWLGGKVCPRAFSHDNVALLSILSVFIFHFQSDIFLFLLSQILFPGLLTRLCFLWGQLLAFYCILPTFPSFLKEHLLQNLLHLVFFFHMILRTLPYVKIVTDSKQNRNCCFLKLFFFFTLSYLLFIIFCCWPCILYACRYLNFVYIYKFNTLCMCV